MEIIFEKVSFKDRLKEINLNVPEGKIIGIVGPSGSGKTLIAEMIDVLERPETGYIKIGKHTIEKTNKIDNINDIRFNVGLVFQNTEEQIFNDTVLDEISFGMKHFKYKQGKINQRVKDALKMVQLKESYLTKNPFRLSAGEMKKVAIASVLAFNPKVLVLDEPMESLDYQSRNNLIKIIRNIKSRYHKTVIILSQNTDFLHKIVDYIYVIDEGKVIIEGDKYDVFSKEETLKKHGVAVPKVIEFANLVENKKGIKIGYRDEINDLIKDIYRYVK